MRYLPALLATLAFLSACATSGQPNIAKPAGERPTGQEQKLVELRAVVTGVDQERRLLALKTDDGASAVIPVAEQLRDFDKLRVGDTVVVSHTEAIAWQVKPADQGAPGVSQRETISNPKPGEAPGGAIERAITMTATISTFDVAHGTVTLTGTQGQSQVVKARNPTDLEHIQVGDLVEITFSEVRALAVRAADKP